MKKINKSNLMKRAWNLFRSNAVVKSFSEALKRAWNEAKEAAQIKVRFRIADWFMNKNYYKVSSAHCECYTTFDKNDILKETEKALFVNLGMRTKSGRDTAYTKKVWIPKSVVESYEL